MMWIKRTMCLIRYIKLLYWYALFLIHRLGTRTSQTFLSYFLISYNKCFLLCESESVIRKLIVHWHVQCLTVIWTNAMCNYKRTDSDDLNYAITGCGVRSMKINSVSLSSFFILSLSLGSVVLCYGVCEWRRPDVSDPALKKVWWSPFPFLCSWGHICAYVPASTRRHLQVYTPTVKINNAVTAYFTYIKCHVYEWSVIFFYDMVSGIIIIIIIIIVVITYRFMCILN